MNLKKISTIILLSSITLSSLSITSSKEVKANELTSDKVINNTINTNSEMNKSDVYTYDEFVELMSKDLNISIEESKKIIGENRTRDGKERTFRNFYATVSVNSVFKPVINFYCDTSEYGNYCGIVKVLNVSLNRKSKQFDGSLYYNLENANTIYWELNGDFFNNGTTTISGGGSVSVGGVGSLQFNVSYSSSHYSYCNKSGRYKIYN